MQADKDAAQLAPANDEHGALWRVSTSSCGPNVLSRRRPQKLQPEGTFTRAPLFEWERISKSRKPRRTPSSPWNSLPTCHVRLKQKVEPRGHAEELSDMQPETAAKRKELEVLTASLADANKLHKSRQANELSRRRKRRASA